MPFAEYKTGWWHVTDVEQLREMIGALNERGVRERELKRFIEKNFSIVKNALAKVSLHSPFCFLFLQHELYKAFSSISCRKCKAV